jgi:hypothetical protein
VNVVRPAPEGGLQPERAVRALCREALSLRSALEMDCWISSLLGQIWEQRGAAPPVRGLDRTFALGVPMMEQIARYGGPGARLTLQAVASVERGGLGIRCGQLAQELSRQRLPRWARQLSPVTLSAALMATVPDDGEVIFLQASGGGRVTHTVSVFVDLRQGGIAKHIALLAPIAVWEQEAFGPDGQLGAEVVRVAPARASERIAAAIRRTDECAHPILGETFVELRAVALARAGSGVGSADSHPGSSAGSRPGSGAGSGAGSRPGSSAGSRPGSRPGSNAGSSAGACSDAAWLN